MTDRLHDGTLEAAEHSISGASADNNNKRRVFRRDEVMRPRAQGLSWRAIAKELGAPASTVVDAARCTEMVPRKEATTAAETKQAPAVA